MLINDFVLSRATSPQYMTQRDIQTGLETLELVHIDINFEIFLLMMFPPPVSWTGCQGWGRSTGRLPRGGLGTRGR